jgi:hypothetical protein
LAAGSNVIIRDDKTPFHHGHKPFVSIRDHIVPHEYYGVGEVEAIRYLQYEVNTATNQLIDNNSLSINRMFKYNKNADLDANEFYSESGHGIGVGHMDDFHWDAPPPVPGQAFTHVAMIKDHMEWVLQLFDTNRGALPQRRETLGGIVMTQGKSDERFNTKIKHIEYKGMRLIAEMMVALNQQFITEERAIKIAGDESISWLPVAPQNILGRFDLRPRGSTAEPMANRAMRRTQFIQFVQLVAQIPPFMKMTNWEELFKRLAREVDVPDPEGLIVREMANQVPGMVQEQAREEEERELPPGQPPLANGNGQIRVDDGMNPNDLLSGLFGGQAQ